MFPLSLSLYVSVLLPVQSMLPMRHDYYAVLHPPNVEEEEASLQLVTSVCLEGRTKLQPQWRSRMIGLGFLQPSEVPQRAYIEYRSGSLLSFSFYCSYLVLFGRRKNRRTRRAVLWIAFRFGGHLVRPDDYVVYRGPAGEQIVVVVKHICWLKHDTEKGTAQEQKDGASSLWIAFRRLIRNDNASPRCPAPLDDFDCYDSLGLLDILPLNRAGWEVR